MKGQTAIEYLMTYGWAILIILIVAGVLAYYGIFAPSGFLAPTARGFGQIQVLNPWSLVASNGALTLNVQNRVGGLITITSINGTINNAAIGWVPTSGSSIVSGNSTIVTTGAPTSGSWAGVSATAGSSYTAAVTIYYTYQGGTFSSTGTISGTYS